MQYLRKTVTEEKEEGEGIIKASKKGRQTRFILKIKKVPLQVRTSCGYQVTGLPALSGGIEVLQVHFVDHLISAFRVNTSVSSHTEETNTLTYFGNQRIASYIVNFIRFAG